MIKQRINNKNDSQYCYIGERGSIIYSKWSEINSDGTPEIKR